MKIPECLHLTRFCIFWMVALLLVLAQTACHDADKYVLTSNEDSVDRLFTLTVQGDTTLPADGFSSVSILATVADVSEREHSVLFSTTAGDLRVGSSVVGDTAVVVASPDGEAPVELLSARVVATARVTAQILDVAPPLRQEVSIRFAPVNTGDVIAFLGAPDSVLADGKELVTLQVRISPDLQGDDRTVVFETTLGVFLLSTGTGSTRIVEADDNDIATARLQSPTEGGEAIITATVRGFRQETSVLFTTVAAVQFVEAPATAPADGATLTRLTVEVEVGLGGSQNRRSTSRLLTVFSRHRMPAGPWPWRMPRTWRRSFSAAPPGWPTPW